VRGASRTAPASEGLFLLRYLEVPGGEFPTSNHVFNTSAAHQYLQTYNAGYPATGCSRVASSRRDSSSWACSSTF